MFSIRKALIVLFFFFSGTSSCQSLFTSSNVRSASRHKEKAFNSHNKAMSIDSASLVDPATAVVVATASSSTSIIAKLLGYVMGIGSMSVYTPIIINLLKAKSADGYSIQTWIFNVLGLTLASAYPFQKNFPLSTYIELVILSAQSVGILGLICYYRGEQKRGLIGLAGYSILASLLATQRIPPQLLNSMQLIASLVCNYANIPQILLTFREKRAAWSPITAGMSVGGNAIRIYTTVTLTKDPLFLFGYLLGFITNGILLVQTFIYKKK